MICSGALSPNVGWVLRSPEGTDVAFTSDDEGVVSELISILLDENDGGYFVKVLSLIP